MEPSFLQFKSWLSSLNIFEYISNDVEQTWHRLKRLFIFFTLSGGGGAGSLGEALENRVGPLVEGGELEHLEGADGDTGKETDGEVRGGGGGVGESHWTRT